MGRGGLSFVAGPGWLARRGCGGGACRGGVVGGKVLTRVRNTGNLHISVDTISVKGTGGSAAATFSKDGPGWYVLPGATRVFEVPMTAAECKSTTQVAVEVVGHNASLKGASQVSPAACAAP